MITAQSLADNNLAYREPALYDELLADDTVTEDILDLVDHVGAAVGSVLDLGCGTGRVLAELHTRRGWQTTGVDLQPGLLDHARRCTSGLVLNPGDIRTVRLGVTFGPDHRDTHDDSFVEIPIRTSGERPHRPTYLATADSSETG